jgi:hypothetical protein
VKVIASAVLMFLTVTKWKVELVASNNQRAATVATELELELTLELELEIELELMELLELFEELLPPQLTPLSVNAVGTDVLGLFTLNPTFTVPLAARLPLYEALLTQTVLPLDVNTPSHPLTIVSLPLKAQQTCQLVTAAPLFFTDTEA